MAGRNYCRSNPCEWEYYLDNVFSFGAPTVLIQTVPSAQHMRLSRVTTFQVVMRQEFWNMTIKDNSTVSSHDRILLAAKRLFAQQGYENTSTVAIARDAGTSESQLMKHFGSKQGLLVAIFDRGWVRMNERIQMIPQGSPADRLLAVLEAITVELENDPELKVLSALEARRVSKDSNVVLLSRGALQYRKILDRILEDMRNEGQIRADVNLDAVRAAVVGMTEGLWRDQVVADRSELPAHYTFDDVHKVLELLIGAFQEPNYRRAKAS
jgi:AcrR family transcriptional regulator